MLIPELPHNTLTRLNEKLKDYFFKLNHRKNDKCFSRKRKLSYRGTICQMINFHKKSNAIETYNFARDIADGEPVSRQAFDDARDKVKYTAFQELFEDTVKLSLEVEDAYLFHGYRTAAIDGTLAMLPNSKELIDIYGQSTPSKGKVYLRCSILFDVLNNTILDGEVSPFTIGERVLALRHIDKNLCGNLLCLMDRGYWSPKLLSIICDKEQKFLIRVSSSSVPKIIKSEESSGTFEIKYAKESYSLRYYKFMLDSGIPEYLVTNLNEREVPDDELSKLYNLRWGIETKYDELKNRIGLEDFSGKDDNSIKQDFYACLLVSNLSAFATNAAAVKVKADRAGKNNKYEYKPNGSFAAAVLKNRMILTLLEDDPNKRSAMFNSLVNDISRNAIPIRPDRHPKRSMISGKVRKPRRRKSSL